RQLAVGNERRKVAADRGDARRVAFDPQPAPAFHQELRGVALDAGLDPELDEGAALRTDTTEDFGDDAVLVVLRINLVAVTQEPAAVGVARLRHLLIPRALHAHLREIARLLRLLFEQREDFFCFAPGIRHGSGDPVARDGIRVPDNSVAG